MTWRPAPSLTAILADANRVAPNRSHASDGTIGDAFHSASVSDHNPDSRGVVHAVDVTNDPAHGMDTWAWAQKIAARMVSGAERRVHYLVSNDGTHDKIFNLDVSPTWRNNNAGGGQSHRNHLHVSIKYTAEGEGDIGPFFVSGAAGPTPAPKPPAPPALEEEPVSSTVIYPVDKKIHRFYVDPVSKKLMHKWTGSPAVENLNKVAKNGALIGPLDPIQPVDAAIVPDTMGSRIEVTAVAPTGWVTTWTWDMKSWSVTALAPVS